ncbi:MAG: hypothetical protein ACRD2W_09010 [Acidimicrobiales bacterium]
MAAWLVAALGLGGLLLLAERARSPLDDPDPARQRPGLLDLGALPAPAPQVTEQVPSLGRPAVIFFERPERLGRLCTALARHRLARDAAAAIVVSGPGGRCADPVVVVDPTRALQRRYGLPSPPDGGPAVGYAVVDAGGRIRYRTLDPTVAHNLAEVDTIVAAT